MNEVKLIGKVWRNPELKFTTNGKSYIKSSILVSRGKDKKEGDFIPIMLWGGTAEEFVNTVRERTLIELRGNLRSGSYVDKNGNKKYTLDVLVNDFVVKDNIDTSRNIDYNMTMDEDVPF